MTQPQKQPFALSRVSNYLQSLVDPSHGLYSNPDDRVVRHILRQETVTATVPTSATQKGLFVIYPLTTDPRRAFHYVCTDELTNSWVLQDVITQSQNLSENYNYGRITASKLVIEASTLSTTEAILSGNMNTVHYEAGGLSELGLNNYTSPDNIYSSLLGSTTNHLDKEVQIRMAEGVVVLGIPNDASVSYDRLDDPAPFTNGLATVRRTYYSDSEHALNVNVTTDQFFSVTSASQVLHTFNCDLGLSSGRIVTVARVGSTASVGLNYQLLNCFGNVIGPAQPAETQASFTPNSAGDVGMIHFITIVPPQNEPVCAIRVSGRIFGTPNPGTLQYMSHTVTIDKGKMYGAVSPVVVSMYSGLAPDVAISLRGHVNYELVPNPNLLRQMETHYGPYDKHEFEYIKLVLSHRDELGLKTVIRAGKYPELRDRIYNAADLTAPTAEAGGFSTLLKGLKTFGPPLLSSILASSGQISNAAGGTAYAMSDDDFTVVADEQPYPQRLSHYMATGQYNQPQKPHRNYRDLKRTDPKDIPRTTQKKVKSGSAYSFDFGQTDEVSKAALFPVIITQADQVTGASLYVIMDPIGTPEHYFGGQVGYTASRTGTKRVYGRGLAGTLPFDLDKDYMIFQVEHTDLQDGGAESDGLDGAIKFSEQYPPIKGNSWFAACAALVAMNTSKGVIDKVITGGTTTAKPGELPLQLPNAAFNMKLDFMKQWYGSDAAAILYGAPSGRPFPLYRPKDRGQISGDPTYPEFDSYQIAKAMLSVGDLAKKADMAASEGETQDILDEADGQAVGAEPAVDEDLDDVDLDKLIAQVKEETRREVEAERKYKPRQKAPKAEVTADEFMQAVEIKKNRPGKLDIMTYINEDLRDFPEHTADVLEWIVRTGLISNLYTMSKTDPNGQMMHRLVRPYTEVFSYGGDRKSQAAQQLERANRIFEKEHVRFNGLTLDWVIGNGFKGPDASQVAYYRANGVLPDPGDMTFQGQMALRPANREEALIAMRTTGVAPVDTFSKKIANIIASDIYSTPWLENALKTFVDSNRRMPTTEELMALKGQDPDRKTTIADVKNSKSQQMAASSLKIGAPIASSIFANTVVSGPQQTGGARRARMNATLQSSTASRMASALARRKTETP